MPRIVILRWRARNNNTIRGSVMHATSTCVCCCIPRQCRGVIVGVAAICWQGIGWHERRRRVNLEWPQMFSARPVTCVVYCRNMEVPISIRGSIECFLGPALFPFLRLSWRPCRALIPLNLKAIHTATGITGS